MSLKLNELLVTSTTIGSITGNANSATLYANTGSYGSWKIGGTKGGWYGIEFESNVSLMANNNAVGFHRNGSGWQLYWAAGTAYCFKGDPGGGVQAVILDTSNYTGYTAALGSGNTFTGVNVIQNTANTFVNTVTNANQSLTLYQGTAGADAYMTFHIGSDWAGYFGLGGAENDLVWGGWSVGNNRYRILHSGNAAFAWNMNQNVRTTDSVSFTTFGIQNTTDTNGRGISLYNGATAGEPTYGLMFQGTGTFGTHGAVTGGWATYFTMNNDNTRGWIFRKVGVGNAASISAGGVLTTSSIRVDDGAVSTPSYTFASDTDTGMFRNGNNNLGMAAGGVLGFAMTSTAMSTILPYLFVGGMTAWNTTTPGTTKGFLHLGDASSTSNTGVGITWGARDADSGTTAQAGIYVVTDGTYGTKMYFATTNNYGTGAQTAMRIEHTGDVVFSRGSVGVGTSPAYKLDVNGACHASSFPTSSDARFKKNIKPIQNSLDKINKINGVVYEWNEFVHARRDGYELNTPIIGVIAQDLEKVLPEVVSKWSLSEDCPDARAVDYIRIIPVLIEAIKELNNKNSILEARILALENKQ